MKRCNVIGLTLGTVLAFLPLSQVRADGGYFSRRSVAVSADQRAIIIRNGDEVSMTFSTGYTGDGDDFGWVIPVPVPPAAGDVFEAGEAGNDVFTALDRITAPQLITHTGGGCFPAGTEVLTADGPRAIETVQPGTEVQACDPATGEWVFAKAARRQSLTYSGDMITVRLGTMMIRATGNHPFFVRSGSRLSVRPLPQDVPAGEQGMSERGRWVEARDLRVGDVLEAWSGDTVVTGVSSAQETIEVFNFDVEGRHSYAVQRAGILVHNKGKSEAAPGTDPTPPVTVYGTVTLEHYEASILGAAGSSALMSWLEKNGYRVNPGAGAVLDAYIRQRWAFIAVKLNPGEKRHYENEFLPPLTIRYRHGELVFPLRISSVSSVTTVRIVLYVIAESTVSSSNWPTAVLRYTPAIPDKNPEQYVEARIRNTIGSGARGLVVMWSGELSGREAAGKIPSLMGSPFPAASRTYLTRLETRIDPAAMTEDIRFALDPRPRVFSVTLQARTNSSRPSYSSFGSLAVDASGCAYAAGWIRGTLRYSFGAGVEALGAFRDSNAVLVKYDSSGVARWARTILEGSNRSCFTSAMVDGSGNVYAAGYLLGAGTFSFGHGVSAATPSSGFNAVLIKYDPAGVAQWVRTPVAGSGASSFISATLDPNGNVFAAGYLPDTRTCTFGEGVTATGAFGGTAVLVKYDSSGTALWARTVDGGTNAWSHFNSIVADAKGNVYVTGSLSPGIYIFDEGVWATGTKVSGYQAVLVKYGPSGAATWARTIAEGSNSSSFNSATVDGSGGVYVAGYLSGTGTCSFGEGVSVSGPFNGSNAVLVKFSSSGVPQWSRTITEGNGGSSFGSSTVDGKGNVYVTGSVHGNGTYAFGEGITVMGTSTDNNAVMVKYDPSGTSRWARTPAPGADASSYAATAADTNGNMYIVGNFFGAEAYEPRDDVTGAGMNDGTNAVMMKSDPAGRALWIRTVAAD